MAELLQLLTPEGERVHDPDYDVDVSGEQLRGLLALLLLAVAGTLLVDLTLTPGDIFTVVTQRR